jgi:uncharacterized membrane protein YgcG
MGLNLFPKMPTTFARTRPSADVLRRVTMGTRDPDPRTYRWRSRPGLSFCLRAFAILVPAAAGASAAIVAAGLLPRPDGLAGWFWLLGLVVLAWVAAAIVERLARRVLPLAVLFQLSLVFPDAAPSRFKLARGNGNVRVLETRIRQARERGLEDDPARAAAQVLSLVAALSQHDPKTRGHSERVRAFTDLIADELKLPEETRERIRWAALLHDIGKLEVPPRILNKPGKPTAAEWEALQRHPGEGARIAAPLLLWLGEEGDAIAQHHERHDGTGYPGRLAGEEIALAGRVVAVADSFEVMTAARTYKKPMSVSAARQELARCAGSQFSPMIVRAFFNISIGRLWWTVGPASWIALLPFLGQLQRAGEQTIMAVKSAAIVASLGGTSLLSVTPAVATPAARSNGAIAPLGIPGDEGAFGDVHDKGTKASGGDGGRGGRDDVKGGGGGSEGSGSGSGDQEGSGGSDGSDTGTVSGIGKAADDLLGSATDAVNDLLGSGPDPVNTVSQTTDTVDTTVSDTNGGLLP